MYAGGAGRQGDDGPVVESYGVDELAIHTERHFLKQQNDDSSFKLFLGGAINDRACDGSMS
jgi:hypothetical protein